LKALLGRALPVYLRRSTAKGIDRLAGKAELFRKQVGKAELWDIEAA